MKHTLVAALQDVVEVRRFARLLLLLGGSGVRGMSIGIDHSRSDPGCRQRQPQEQLRSARSRLGDSRKSMVSPSESIARLKVGPISSDANVGLIHMPGSSFAAQARRTAPRNAWRTKCFTNLEELIEEDLIRIKECLRQAGLSGAGEIEPPSGSSSAEPSE